MSLAARWAAWDRWRGGPQAGPFADTGSPGKSDAHPHVELLIGNDWVDITEPVNYVRYADRINITRGRADEQGSQTEASTCTFTVDNRDGRFTPTNPLGEWYGRLKRGTRVRVYRVIADVRYYRFWGEISSLPTKWDISGTDVNVPITASGIYRRLNQGATPLRSAAFRALLSAEQISSGDDHSAILRAYWPMEDAEGATTVSSGIGLSSMTIDGSPQFAAYTDLPVSDALPTINDARLTGQVPAYNPYEYYDNDAFTFLSVAGDQLFILTDPTSISTDAAPNTTSMSQVTFFLHTTSAPAAERSLVKFYTSGDVTLWDLRVTTAGALRLRAYDSDNTSLLDTGALTDFNVDTGDKLQVYVMVGTLGGVVNWSVQAFNAGQSVIAGDSGAFGSGYTDGPVTTVVVNDTKNLPTDLTIGHLSVVSGGDFGTSLGADVRIVSAGAETETADARVARILTEELINVDFVSIASGSGDNDDPTRPSMGTQPNETLVSLIQECADAGQLLVFETRDDFGIAVRRLFNLYDQTPASTLDYSAHQLADALNPTYDDQGVNNDVTLSRTNGGTVHVEQTTGPMSTAEPPDGIDRYDTSETVNLAFDQQLYDLAYWRLHVGTVEDGRYPQLAVQLASADYSADDVIDLLTVDIGDLITVTNPPSWMPPGDINLLVQGYTESIDQFLHDITFNCSPGQVFDVAQYDGNDRFDTQASQIAGEVAAGVTTFNVATTAGPLWTTSAGDFPFDVIVSGEQVTVTNITGSSSPQTFTATRGVNGVSKTLKNEDAVKLYKASIRAW